MPRLRDERTTAQNLEEKLDEGEVALDYFDLFKAGVIRLEFNAQSF